MGNLGGVAGRAKYHAPSLRAIEPHEVIRKLVRELDGPLGGEREQRITKAARLIRGVLERLPAEERNEALRKVVVSGRPVEGFLW